MKTTSRVYHQAARADTTAETTRLVLQAAGELLGRRWYDDVTLEDIAAHAGVSARTVQRKFGSKDRLAREYFLATARESLAQRDRVGAGDIDGAIATIVAMYETMGDNIMRYLALEQRIPIVSDVVEAGRSMHRAWIERVFAPMLPASGESRRVAIALLVVATDVYTWKLLRRDARLSRSATSKAMHALATATVTLQRKQKT